LKTVILRYFNVYGPGGHSVINKFVDDIVRGQQIIVFGNGGMKRDYIYVDDVVRVNLLAMDSRKTGTYNVGTGIATSVSKLIEVISKALGKKPLLSRGKQRESEIFYSCADTRKAEKMLGFRYKISLEHGIKKLSVNTKIISEKTK
jgi:UDP-glucose 4-epimerase